MRDRKAQTAPCRRDRANETEDEATRESDPDDRTVDDETEGAHRHADGDLVEEEEAEGRAEDGARHVEQQRFLEQGHDDTGAAKAENLERADLADAGGASTSTKILQHENMKFKNAHL